jgi:hypothetical protein
MLNVSQQSQTPAAQSGRRKIQGVGLAAVAEAVTGSKHRRSEPKDNFYGLRRGAAEAKNAQALLQAQGVVVCDAVIADPPYGVEQTNRRPHCAPQRSWRQLT